MLHGQRYHQSICSPLDNEDEKCYTIDRKDLNGCCEIAPQPYALQAPTPRVKRNFGLT